jgi:hypothetical protein
MFACVHNPQGLLAAGEYYVKAVDMTGRVFGMSTRLVVVAEGHKRRERSYGRREV